MDFSQPFSVLNEKLKPRVTSSEQLYSSLNRLEDRQLGSLRNRATSYRATILPAEPQPNVFLPEPEDPLEPGHSTEPEDQMCDSAEELNCANLLSIHDSCLIRDLNLKDEDESEQLNEDDGTQSEEKDGAELASEGKTVAGVGGSPFQRCFMDGTLPDLIRTGRTLGRRRTLGHVSDTLKEVRREVELSRRRSIKLKAQVDKLQESGDGLGWSRHRERVTEEVLSILRLLHPLTEPESSRPASCEGENGLDAALSQLQNVARKLAISHTKQEVKPGTNGAEESGVLQQALRDRDEAIEKKKAMEGEVLRSKTEMMTLNNHLLEAAQKRLELSLELEAWKEDFQRILQQQVYSQQLAEQAQKKTSRLGLLRRGNKPPIQRPPNFPLSAPTPPTTNSSQIFVSRPAASATPSTPPAAPATRNWMDKLKKGKSSWHGEQTAAEQEARGRNDGFQVVSLD
ncbi:bicaudal-D-related protein 2-like [Odontesthes bonariensis]|uniref:bicaudal-D-related protein 2-like n=1 Tax=Odontesthes bonariensis TaxID=219752 RepID=UPI003F581C67